MKEITQLLYNSTNPLPDYYALGQTEMGGVIKALCDQNVHNSLRTCGAEEFVLNIADTDISISLLKTYKGYWLGLLTIMETSKNLYIETYLSAEDVIDYLKKKGVLS